MRRLRVKIAVVTALLLSAAAVYAAELVFSDHRPTNGDTNQVLAAKALALITCKFTRINTNTTTVVKSGAGSLQNFTINTKGASANTATLYDNTSASGTIIAVIDTTSANQSLFYNVAFNNGLTIVTATGTAPDVTVSWR